MNMHNDLPKNDDGTLASYAWPGGYPIYYICKDSGVLCPKCANSKECKEALEDCPDDAQWLIVAAGINYEDPDLYCDHCSERIESAYAEDEIDAPESPKVDTIIKCQSCGISIPSTIADGLCYRCDGDAESAVSNNA